ncbi:helix-turn-helix domain-containing protein [Trujillonella endophytica]|uniref:PucR C-terminal helix-turn-helix domain-containing protein n=1 Tax=Trujillonella endophytica TaxID=673521 RepID=A0A1H8PFM6_9ACTN|nr:helix-turn-helix domain-containing protein [Trujillella endophytica]SEO40611.1 PucR C-terminal helix-turn-helix domain-containing protein [Trujillella endophytica]
MLDQLDRLDLLDLLAVSEDDVRVNDLVLRLAELDPQASDALRVIGHFDSLVASQAGLQSIVRGAATLAGCPVRLTDPEHRLTVRVSADGVAAPPVAAADTTWPSTPVGPDGAVLWLETSRPPGTLESVVLERAAAAAQAVLQRTRGRRRAHDQALVELVLDAGAEEPERLAAARWLGLTGACRAVALDRDALALPADRAVPEGRRAGVGPAVDAADLPASWAAARLALRLTAEGTAEDPGPRIVHADDLGAVTLLVEAADARPEPVPDVRALDRASAGRPWLLVTLDAVARAASLRDAARVLQVHHSTLQERLASAESLLGWRVRHPEGRLRLQMALLLRRAARTPAA